MGIDAGKEKGEVFRGKKRGGKMEINKNKNVATNVQPPSRVMSDPGEEIKLLRQELENEKNHHLRALADFDNYRKRVARDAEMRGNEAKKALVVDLLYLIDNLEQALKQINDEKTVAGLRLIYQRFLDLLKKHGVTPVDCLGKPFDPAEQEGLAYLETVDYPEGHVAEELCRGYKFGDELLRPARVRVARRS
jgi:molecular chaperone GrpE